MPQKSIQLSFAGGEIAPEMQGRQDDVKYQNGLKFCRNFICEPQGSIRSRPGLEFVQECGDESKQVRLIPFRYNSDQTLVIELGNYYARFHAEGSTVCDDDGNIYQIKTPWPSSAVMGLHYAQSGDVLTIVHAYYPPTELRRYGATDWRTATVVYKPPLSAPSGVSAVRITKAEEDPNSEKYTFSYKVACLNSDKSKESEPSSAVSVVANLYAYGTTVRITCQPVTGAAFYRFYKSVGGVYGYIGDSESPEIVDDNLTPKTDVTPRRADDVFSQVLGIRSATVTASGSGYSNDSVTGSSWRPPAREAVDKKGRKVTVSDDRRYGDGAPVVELYSADITNKATLVAYDGGGVGCKLRVRLKCYLGDVVYRSYSVIDDDYESAVASAYISVAGVEVVDGGYGYSEKTKLHFDWGGTTAVLKGSFGSVPIGPFYGEVEGSGVTIAARPQIIVTDSGNGSGAVLEASVSGGKITGVRVMNGGVNYSHPTATIRGGGGSGAKISLSTGEAGDYPSAVGYFEQRRCFAGMRNDPQRIVMTRSGTEDDMTYSLPLRDDDRISVQIATREFNPIRHILPLAHLILLTSGSEIRVSPNDTNALTPTSISIRPQSYIGSNAVQPLTVNASGVYVSDVGGHVYDIGYNYTSNGYASGDLCLRAPHLFDYHSIVDAAYAKAPIPIMFFVSDAGYLASITYIPAQEVSAWYRIETDGVFESIASIPEGGEDRVYVVVRRIINGEARRYVERFASLYMPDLDRAFCVDCGAVYEGDPATEISGLTWLEGKEVAILADGSVKPRQAVTDGKVTLDYPASRVVVGLPYSCDAQTNPVVISGQPIAGAGNAKNIARSHMRLLRTGGIKAGASFDRLVEYKSRTTEQPGTPPALTTGEILLQLRPEWQTGGVICIRQDEPLPATVQALVLDVSM